jgi:uncharacterized protein YbaP (TraB family)
MLKTILRRGLGMLGLAALAGCATVPETASATGRPALWQVADKDTTVYLFGTIHLLPDNYVWRTPAFEKAVTNSQGLIVETIVDLDHPQAFQAQLLTLGYSPGLPPIADRVPPAKLPQLRDAISKTGLSESSFNLMETWYAAFVLLNVQFKAMGLVGQEGPEQTLRHEFSATKKPIGELETNAEQLGYFDKLPETAQRGLLEGSIDSQDATKAQFQQMLGAWTRGDVAAIGASFNKDLSESPELREALLRRRNVNWTRWIERRMTTPGSVLIAVGAGHLAGPGSVVELLKKDGYRVRRVQ